MKIELPSFLTHNTTEELYALLHAYFAGKQLQISPDKTYVEIKWPDSEQFYIDPSLRDGLNWWQENLHVSKLPLQFRYRSGYQIFLNDNWTLYSWSKWAQANFSKGKQKKITILHVDDHRDCMSPLLFKDGNNFFQNPLNKESKVDFFSPESVKLAIESGAIAVGSFMPLFFHSFESIEFRHLLPGHRKPDAYKSGKMKTTFEKDDLLSKGAMRPALMFEAMDSGTDHNYFSTDSLEEFLAEISEDSSVLFHVDMDYFNNRFDGDSDWTLQQTHNPDRFSTMESITSVFSAVFSTIPKHQLEDVTIALSPGFFPAEFWQESIQLIDELLNKR